MCQVYDKSAFIRVVRRFQEVAPHLRRSAKSRVAWLIFDLLLDDVLMTALRRVDIPPRDRKSTDVRFNAADQQTVCRVLNTADYCHRTALQVRRKLIHELLWYSPQLEEKMRDRIDKSFTEKISMQAELEAFLGCVINKAFCFR